MRALKDKGMEDANAIRVRARHQYARQRIDEPTLRRIEDIVNELEAVIVNMTELDEYGDELGDG